MLALSSRPSEMLQTFQEARFRSEISTAARRRAPQSYLTLFRPSRRGTEEEEGTRRLLRIRCDSNAVRWDGPEHDIHPIARPCLVPYGARIWPGRQHAKSFRAVGNPEIGKLARSYMPRSSLGRGELVGRRMVVVAQIWGVVRQGRLQARSLKNARSL